MKFEKCLKTTSKKALHRFTALAAVLLAVCLVFMTPAAAWTVDTGWGTDYDTSTEFTIADAGDLAQFAVMVNGGKDFSGKTVKLTNNIDLENQEWTPIGTNDKKPFTGIFDGNGKTISGLSISASTSTYTGLFGAFAGDVKNLYVSGKVSTGMAAGGIAGINSGKITNCYFIGDVILTSSGIAYAGGITGMNIEKIDSCYSTGKVTVSKGNGDYIQEYAGGIAGQNMGTISKCYALNEEISASTSAGRVTDNNPSFPNLENNFGWAGMKVNNDVVTDGTASNTNGQAIYAETFWNDQNFVIPTATLQSEAAYLKPEITLTYNANGGTGTVSSTYSKYARGEPEKVASEDGLTKTGYTFAGWNTQADGNGNAPEDGYIIIEQATTLYAQWTPITYTVKFNGKGGTGDMQNQDFTYGSGTHLTANAFTKEGHDFAGWALSENGEVEYNDGADGSKLTTTANKLVNLYAVWTPETYTVKFDNNTGAGTMADQEFTYGVSQALSEMTFTAPDDKEFAGWALSANGAPKYSNKATVLNLPYDQNKQITLYANWTSASSTAPTTYTVTFKDGDTIVLELLVSAGEKVQQPQVLPKTGYTLSSWNKEDGTEWDFDSNTVNADTTLIANWIGNTYTVKFNANGGDGTMADQTFTYGTSQALTANAFSKTGHSFKGWAETEGGGVKYTDGQSVSYLAESGTVNLYAVWKINKYTITFDTQGGSVIPPITADYGATINRPEHPTKRGYTIDGSNWNNQIPTSMPAENTIVTAKWNANPYFVQFISNGGTGIMDVQVFKYGTPQILTANNFTAPSGKVFNGWNTKADGSGTAYTDRATVSNLIDRSNGYVYLYAQWKSPSSGGSHSTTKTTYTVTFNANGGVGEMFPQTFTSGKEKALNLNFFTKEGYTFAGWATSADGDVVYTDGEIIKVTKSMTLYAVWESNEPVDPEQPGDEPGQPGDEPENPEKPTEPETPAPILAVLAGLGAAVILRRK